MPLVLHPSAQLSPVERQEFLTLISYLTPKESFTWLSK